MNNYYVYLYIDTSYNETFILNNITYNGRPIYIGKGTKNRAFSHLKLCFSHKYKKPFYDKLKSMLSINNKPNIVIIENNLLEKEAYKKEEYYIRKFKIFTDGGPLYNCNYGGEGGIEPSQIIKDKISAARTGKCLGSKNHNYGWKCKGKDNLFYGKHHTAESKKKMHRKYYILDINTLQIIYVDNLSLWCEQNKHNLTKITEVVNKPMRYKNFVILKYKNYTQDYINNYFNFIKQNIKYLKSSKVNPTIIIPKCLTMDKKDIQNA